MLFKLKESALVPEEKEEEVPIVVTPEEVEEELITVAPEEIELPFEEGLEEEEPKAEKPPKPPTPPPTPPPAPPVPPEEKPPWYRRRWARTLFVFAGFLAIGLFIAIIIRGCPTTAPKTVAIELIAPVDGATVVKDIIFQSSKELDINDITVRVAREEENVEVPISGNLGVISDAENQFFYAFAGNGLPNGAYFVEVTVYDVKVDPPAKFSFTVAPTPEPDKKPEPKKDEQISEETLPWKQKRDAARAAVDEAVK